MAKIITIASSKGGVGKSTCTVNLAYALAEMDFRVLVIDADWQGNATSCLQFNPDASPNLFSCLDKGTRLADAIQSKPAWKQFTLHCIGSSRELKLLDQKLTHRTMKEYILYNLIGDIAGYYDYVLIDNNPHNGLMLINSIVASNYVLIPTFAEHWAVEGIDRLIGELSENIQLTRSQARIMGICFVKYDKRAGPAKQVYQEVAEMVPPELLFHSVIGQNISFDESQRLGLTVFQMPIDRPNKEERIKKARQQYADLAKELTQK